MGDYVYPLGVLLTFVIFGMSIYGGLKGLSGVTAMKHFTKTLGVFIVGTTILLIMATPDLIEGYGVIQNWLDAKTN